MRRPHLWCRLPASRARRNAPQSVLLRWETSGDLDCRCFTCAHLVAQAMVPRSCERTDLPDVLT
jgi:hypothetical protein